MRKIGLVKMIMGTGILVTMGVSLLTGCNVQNEVKDFANYAKSVEEITIPKEVRSVA